MADVHTQSMMFLDKMSRRATFIVDKEVELTMYPVVPQDYTHIIIARLPGPNSDERQRTEQHWIRLEPVKLDGKYIFPDHYRVFLAAFVFKKYLLQGHTVYVNPRGSGGWNMPCSTDILVDQIKDPRYLVEETAWEFMDKMKKRGRTLLNDFDLCEIGF